MRINLLPEQYRPEPAINPLRLTLLIIGGCMIFGATLGLILQTMHLGSETEALAAMNRQIANYQTTLLEINRCEKRLADLNQRLGHVNKIKAAYFQYPFVLQKVSGALKEDMWLESISMAALDPFLLKGKSLVFPNVGELLKNLQDIPELRDVKLTQVEAEDINELESYKFAIKLRPEGGEVANAQVKTK